MGAGGTGRRAALAAAVLVLLMVAAPAAAAQAPRAVITDAPPTETERRDATFAFEASGFTLLGSFECSLDGAAWSRCASPVTYDGLAGGTHEFAVRLVGLLADPTPDRHRWTVLVKTVIAPPPPPPPPTVEPPPPPPKPPAVEPEQPRRDAGGCAYGGNRVGEVSPGRLEAAVSCLVDRVRSEHGLPGLRRVRSLAIAAERHARDMVRRRYFSHTARSGRGPVERARRSGYLRRREGWTIGEVLAWGVGGFSTPAATVENWMGSRTHRRVLLHPAFRDIGVGIVRGIPLARRADGGTFAAKLGRR